MATVGVLVPLERPLEIVDPGEYVATVTHRGYDAIWFRDWPIGQPGPGGGLEQSTGWDPVAATCLLATHARGQLGFGTAILRTDYRLSVVTARAVVSMMFATAGRLRVGLGAGPMREPGEGDRFGSAVSHIWDLLHGTYGEEFVVPEDFLPPPILLACQRAEVWEKLTGRSVGFISTVLNPRALDEALQGLHAVQKPAEVVLLASLEFDSADPDALENRRPFLRLGERRLRQLAAAWRTAGVSEVVVHTRLGTPASEHWALSQLLKESL